LLYTKEKAKEILLVGHGLPGFRDKVQYADNTVFIYPLSLTESKFKNHSNAYNKFHEELFLREYKKL
jgi:hypothetical protein